MIGMTGVFAPHFDSHAGAGGSANKNDTVVAGFGLRDEDLDAELIRIKQTGEF